MCTASKGARVTVNYLRFVGLVANELHQDRTKVKDMQGGEHIVAITEDSDLPGKHCIRISERPATEKC